MRSKLGSIAALIGALGLGACQTYPFEERLPRRSQVQKISEVVLTVKPTDILFVIDNSGTMQEERAEVARNVALFLDNLVESATDFQVGIVTTDVDCNLPTYNCGVGGTTNPVCCTLRGGKICHDTDSDGDGELDTTDCDGGRLRSANGRDRIFARPTEAEKADWETRFAAVITSLDCQVGSAPEGSPYEAGLEAAVRAVSCGAGVTGEACPEPAVAELDAGFIRPDADLVIVFITDEDDCSIRPYFGANGSYTTAYDKLTSSADQATHFCSAAECYSYYDPSIAAGGQFTCNGLPRAQPPPAPDDITKYVDALVAAKGGDARKIRGAAIVSGIANESAPLGFEPGACFTTGGGPSLDCTCLSTSQDDVFCKLTTALGQVGDAWTPTGQGSYSICGQTQPNLGGCTGLPGSRYASFLDELKRRHLQAGAAADVLVDSICRARYDETLYNIVNNIIIKNCFDLGMVPTQASDIQVSLNGTTLANVPKGGSQRGWSWVGGSSEVCLEGGLKKKVDDRFEIYVLQSPG